jgi:hypothetical protein
VILELKSKSTSVYNQFVKDVIESKKQFILNEYRTMKQTKKLPPTSTKKLEAKITRPRLLPFSKA